ncbi:sensor histidine kinase [Brevundimonas sp. Root1279]|uniref:sensor histidine kinase n=1 Tax=Brevundimonas sp. Root1279 TaxID=1736443 RepID=UPI000A5C1DEC|nr:sensor histidine kinase [Brevundimonas sp. Root1279]
MITRSLRLRLLLGAGAAILVALLVAWIFMGLLFERHLERRMAVELTGDATRLAAALTVAPDGRLGLSEPLPDPRLQTPASGFYWQVSGGGRVLRSRSLWDETLAAPPDAPADEWGLRRAAGPFDQEVFLLERQVQPDADSPPLTIQLAQDASAIATAQAEFGRELAGFLAALWLVLIAAAWLQVHLGLQPLRGLRDRLAALRSNSSARLDEPWLNDVRPLTEAINELAEAREADLQKARARASDLAHGLKTPLAALKAQSRRLREAGQTEIADGLDRSIAALAATTEAELARSRIAAAGQGGGADARDSVEQLISVLEQTDQGEAIAFTNDIADGVAPPLSRDDLTELIGPLLENAVRFARRQVVARGRTEDAGVVLWIDDDGPGIPSTELTAPTGRGVRLDQTSQGQGLGLSIAAGLAEASGGRLTLSRSALGGLCVEVRWNHDDAR